MAGQVTTTQVFTDGMTLTAATLTAILANSSVDATAITAQTAETTVAAGDLLLVWDTSAGALRKVAIGELLARPLAIGGTTPAAGTFSTVTSTNKFAGPGIKAWGFVTVAGLVVSGTGIASVTNPGAAGNFVITLNPAMTGTDYTAVITPLSNTTPRIPRITTQTNNTINVTFESVGAVGVNPTHFAVAVFQN